MLLDVFVDGVGEATVPMPNFLAKMLATVVTFFCLLPN